tara:strand:+ start:500 stop:898 length:399 start_codon:yes stop_codon:yes gene_type:complete
MAGKDQPRGLVMELWILLMKARIYRPVKNAMQSGMNNTRKWVLEFMSDARKQNDPLMGWTGGGKTSEQVKVKFDSQEEAVEYAKRNDIDFVVLAPKERKNRIKAYADNFSYGRRLAWDKEAANNPVAAKLAP